MNSQHPVAEQGDLHNHTTLKRRGKILPVNKVLDKSFLIDRLWGKLPPPDSTPLSSFHYMDNRHKQVIFHRNQKEVGMAVVDKVHKQVLIPL